MDENKNNKQVENKEKPTLTDTDFKEIPRESHKLHDEMCTKCGLKKAVKNGLCQECINKETKVFQT